MNARIAATLLGIVLSGPLLADEPAKEAVEAAAAWLNLVDTEQYQKSWSAASAKFRKSRTLPEWTHYLQSHRHGFGLPSSRSLTPRMVAASDAEQYKGNWFIEARTFFLNGHEALEKIILQPNGSEFEVVGYLVKGAIE